MAGVIKMVTRLDNVIPVSMRHHWRSPLPTKPWCAMATGTVCGPWMTRRSAPSWARDVLLVALTVCGLHTIGLAQDEADGNSPADGHFVATAADQDPSRITDQQIPLMAPDQVVRPKPILELGHPFQAPGLLNPGFTVPGGAVWRPSLLVFGTYRTAVQAFDNGDTTVSEWANRLDLLANLQLSGTERVLAGFRPLDKDGRFTGYKFNPDRGNGREDELNIQLTTLFFEGDFGQLFPNLDPDDSRRLDWGFAVGRQPLFFQEGMLINDDIDAIGIVRNTILPKGASNLRVTVLYGWNEIHRDDNRHDDSAHLLGIFTESDWSQSTVALDVVYIYDEDRRTDGLYWGFSSVQRIGHLNTSFRALGSHALKEQSEAVSSGYLFFGELSWSPTGSPDLVYINAFWGVDQFSSASRGPATGGPLGRTGILFAAVGLGRFGAALGNRADQSVGAAIGYQLFLDQTRKQIVFEFGGRRSTESQGDGAIAAGVRYQQAFGQHAVLQVDVLGAVAESRDEGWGTRLELRYEF